MLTIRWEIFRRAIDGVSVDWGASNSFLARETDFDVLSAAKSSRARSR